MSLNFLKNLFNFYTEKKPKVDMSKFGVFIRSCGNDGEVIDGCRRFHQDIKSDAKIVAVKRNEACKGMEVFFNSGSGVLELLKKKYLNGSDGGSTIHSLTTALSLHDAFPTEEEDFKQAIRSQIQNQSVVQVLDVLKVPFNWEYPDIGSGKWIIVLDVPEVDELDVFKKMGLPDNMVMDFPNGDRYSVKFYCRLCQKDGHVQFQCSDGERASSSSNRPSFDESNNVESPMALTSNLCPTESRIHPLKPKDVTQDKASNLRRESISIRDLNATTSPSARPINPINKEKVTSLQNPSPSKFNSGFRIRDLCEERDEHVPKPNKSALSQEVIDAFAIEIGEKEAQRYYTDPSVKQEQDAMLAPSPSLKRPGSEMKPPYSAFPNVEKPSFYEKSSNRASSTTTDIDPVIIFESKPSLRPDCSQNPPDNSPVVTTTHHQSDAAVKIEPPITDEEDSNPAPKRRKKASPMLQVVIPENIRDIINAIPDKVLDIRQLEAFFNHVKKKSRPADFARMYTENVEGLFEQLSEISRRYYLRPIVGSNEDLKFVKMLGNVLQRFHNGPAKRKSDAKT